MKLVVFSLGEFFGHLVGDPPGVFKNAALVEPEEGIKFGYPILHVHGMRRMACPSA